MLSLVDPGAASVAVVLVPQLLSSAGYGVIFIVIPLIFPVFLLVRVNDLTLDLLVFPIVHLYHLLGVPLIFLLYGG